MRTLRIVSIILVLATVVSACAAPAATPAPAAQAPAAQAPAAAPAASGSNWCSNVKIVFFPGGPEGGVFAVNVYNGAVQAAKDTGAQVNYVWSNWDTQKMIQQFTEAAATKPDGIAVMGHPGDESFGPLIDAAESKGILVTSQNTELPKAQAKYGANGFGYVGAVNYDAGHALGAEAVKRFGLKSGDRAMVWGLLSQPSRGERTKGVIDAFKEAGLTVDYNEIDSATNSDPAAGTATFVGYVSAHPDVKIVVTDHGGGHPYMDHWWVPGLQIGYEHSFVHQVADFLQGLETLSLRMERHVQNAQKVVDFLAKRSEVTKVIHPSQQSGEARRRADKYLKGGYGAWKKAGYDRAIYDS